MTQPDRPVGRGKVLSPCALAKYAEERGLTEVIKPEKVNDPEPMEMIRAWKPDVIAVVAFGQILKKPLLDLPLFGCVNCHFSLLPKYRGAAPVIAALEAGDRMTGVTVMHMGVGLDDGPIMLQSFEPIYPDTTGGALMADLAIAGGVALAKALRLLNSNALPPEVKQDEASATYVKKLKKTDGLIDWDRPVLEIERRIRAYNPWPCCYTFMPEKFRIPENCIERRANVVADYAEEPCPRLLRRAGAHKRLLKDGFVLLSLLFLDDKHTEEAHSDKTPEYRKRRMRP